MTHRTLGSARWSSVVLVTIAAAACSRTEPTPAPAAAASGASPATPQGAVAKSVTLLVTANENGNLTRSADAPEGAKGGAAELLGQWVANEQHCAGKLGAAGAAACPNGRTLVLSAGDHWGGPAISSFFAGMPTATAMARMGYAASALGNHEFDFSRDAFIKAQSEARFPHLAANATVDPGAMPGVTLPPFQVFERNGIKIGVVGLASKKTKSSVMAGHAEGLEVASYEAGLTSAVPKAWNAGADAVVVLAHECPDLLAPVVASHPEWKIALVAGACRVQTLEKKGNVTFASAGGHFDSYLRAELTIDTTKPAAERVATVAASHVPVAASAPDAELAKEIAASQKRLDAALGEEIGVTTAGLAQGSPEIGKWIATALKDVYKTDIALVNKKGIRQSVAPGKITQSSVYSALPYENSVFIVKVKGSDLIPLLAQPDAVSAGATAAGKDAAGKALDPAKVYSVATLDYLYFGGDGFGLEKLDADAKETGMLWQTAVIEWTKGKKTTAAKPLEAYLR